MNSYPLDVTLCCSVQITQWLFLLLQVLNPFYVFQAFTLTLWLCQGYIEYSVAIIILTIISIALSVYDLRQVGDKSHLGCVKWDPISPLDSWWGRKAYHGFSIESKELLCQTQVIKKQMQTLTSVESPDRGGRRPSGICLHWLSLLAKAVMDIDVRRTMRLFLNMVSSPYLYCICTAHFPYSVYN